MVNFMPAVWRSMALLSEVQLNAVELLKQTTVCAVKEKKNTLSYLRKTSLSFSLFLFFELIYKIDVACCFIVLLTISSPALGCIS